MEGYKAFNKNMTNRYGMLFQVGKIYQVDGELSFGNRGNGIHFCKRLEDTLRYFPAMDSDILIAKITSLGDYVEYWDDYYGYYDMYAARSIHVDRILKREEIIEMFLNLYEERVIRFISAYKLTNEEKLLFKIKYANNYRILQAIEYYQEGNTSAYEQENAKRFIKYIKKEGKKA